MENPMQLRFPEQAEDQHMRIHFLGGAGTVTGSKFLVETNKTRLLVDCGLFQGLKALRLRNRMTFPFPAADVDAIVLTHAHIDHSGYLPVLVRDGFRGPIYATEATRDLTSILLPDSGYLQEEDARYANEKQFSRHHPALPLYTEEDAVRAAAKVRGVERHKPIQVGDLEVTLQRAGHILGASTVTLRHGDKTILFSGDLGRNDDLLMQPPEEPEAPDFVVMESTYGNRRHSQLDPLAEMAEVVSRVVARRGVVLIPSFAVGRAQLMLYCLHRLMAEGRVPQVPVYINSPMATDVTRIFEQYHEEHRLDATQCAEVCASARFVGSVKESMELNRRSGPMVIISASGMLTGGRILHHVKRFGPDQRNAILLPGFQAAGTRGQALLQGADDLKIHGRRVPIHAEVVHLDSFSAHADRDDLLGWVGACRQTPKRVFLVHGEPAAADALRQRIEEKLSYAVTVPDLGATVELA